MKNCIILLFTAMLFAGSARGQKYTVAEKGSGVNFSIVYHKDEGQTVRGRLSGVKGRVTFDPANLGTASFDVTVSTATAVTGIQAADEELKKEAYFNTAKYPTIHIRSQKVTVDEPGSTIYTLHGELTLKGITKPVKVQFMGIKSGNGYLLRGSFHLSRKVYAIGKPDDKLDDNVDLFIELRVTK